MITVVIPMYNAEKTIERAIDSIVNQTRFDAIRRIIVIDDGSTDESATIVNNIISRSPEKRVELYRQMNKGPSAARNLGIQKADTKYLAFLDADDIWLPHKIEVQLDTIKENPQIRFLGTGVIDGPLRIGTKRIDSLYNGTVKDVCKRYFPSPVTVLMEKSLVDEVGFYDENQRYSEDINYFQKIAAKGNYYYLPVKTVEIGIDKKYFAESGLTSNLKGMHYGALKNLKELLDAREISPLFYAEMRVFYQLKHWRRVVLQKIKRKKCKV